MIKLILCCRRKDDLSVPEFRKAWQEYREFLTRLGTELGALRVSFSLTLAIEENERFQVVRGMMSPYDGIIEMWWRNAAAFQEAMAREGAGELILDNRRRQSAFLDVASSTMFFASEELVRDLS